MERIKYDEIYMHPQAQIRHAKILEAIQLCGDGVLLTDALSHRGQGGLVVTQILRQAHSDRRFKLRPLINIWGQPVKTGDKVEWHVETLTRDPFGKKITNQYKKDLIRRGRIREIEIWHEAIVDKHGCIDVSLDDALLLLDNTGVHFESKEPLSRMPETTTEPKPGPDGKMRQQHFWLYEEVPAEEYAKLSRRRKPKTEKEESTPAPVVPDA